MLGFFQIVYIFVGFGLARATTLSNEAYYAMGGGGLVFILLVVGCCCCCCCCRSKKSNRGKTVAKVQQAMPSVPNTIALGYNLPVSPAPIIKSKKSSSLASWMGKKMLKMAVNEGMNEMGESSNEMG